MACLTASSHGFRGRLFVTEKNTIEGFPTEVKIPEKMLRHVRNVREVVCKHFGESWCSVQTMKTTVKQNSVEWDKFCSSWWMSEKFLEDHMDELLEAHLKSCLLACLPQAGESRDMNKALVACRALTTGITVMSAVKSKERELSAAVNVLQDMCEARSLSLTYLANMSDFALNFVKRCESFCTLQPGLETQSNLGVKKKILGKEAINFRYDLCLADPNLIKPND